MSEPNTEDRWAALAGNLGVELGAENPQTAPTASKDPAGEPKAAAAPPAPIFQAPAKPVRQDKKPAKPAAWDHLAGELGLTPMPPPAPPVQTREEPKKHAPSHPAPPPKREERIEQAEFAAEIEIEAELSRWGEFEPDATEPLGFEPQEALEILDETSCEFDDEHEETGEAGAQPAGEGPAPEGEERRGRRRRRRGRGRGRGRETTERREGRSPEASTDLSAGERAFDDPEVVLDEGIEEEKPEAAHREEGEGERDDRRGRPRRRGRGAAREPIRKEVSDEAEDFADDDESAEFAEGEEDEAIHAGGEFEGDFDGDEDDDGGESPRIGFRNIPTWDDAIGVMIAKNMEARVRNPGGSRGPGGRGRGGRGGRGGSGGGGGGGRGRGRSGERH